MKCSQLLYTSPDSNVGRSYEHLRVARVSSLVFCCSQLLPVCPFHFNKVKRRHFTLVLSSASVELTSILVYLHRLRVMALHSSGCRATVESLYSSSTSLGARAMSAKFKAFQFPVLKVILLFRIPFFRSSAYSSVPYPISLPYQSKPLCLQFVYNQGNHSVVTVYI